MFALYQGGPGEIICTIDGKDCSTLNWKCNDIGANQTPAEAYPGINRAGFDVSGWTDPVVCDHDCPHDEWSSVE